MKQPQLIVADLFCGAGGVTTGFMKCKGRVKVIACVNHDPKAIESHWMNHKSVKHYEEDIRTLDLTDLVKLVNKYRLKYPDAKFVLHASLECTNFSKAKGGLPREADSRTLADHLDRYVIDLNPDYVTIENVVEFMSWGPLDDNGKPISSRNGSDWMKWRNRICSYGYYDDWKEMNAANFGAYTSRNRLFGIFAKHHLPIAWPEPTHAKNPGKSDMFTNLKKWKAVRDVLQLEEKGVSILARKKPLSEKTLERVYAGLIKFVAGGKENFIVKYNSNRADGTVWKGNDTDAPCPTISTQGRLALCSTEQVNNTQFISKYYSGRPEHKNITIEGPAGTIRTSDGQALVSSEFLQHYYGNGFCTGSDEPAPTVTTKDRCGLVQPKFLMNNFTNGGSHSSIDAPSGSLMTIPKQNLVTAEPFIVDQNFNNGPKPIDEPINTIMACRKHKYIVQYLMNPQYMSSGGDIDKPSFTLIARMDKAPPYLVSAENGSVGILVYESDSPMMVKIKEFMALYNISDIFMRMLMVPELLLIQGFPKSYKLAGNQTDQKKFIGNSVVPDVIQAWAMALTERILIHNQKLVA